MIFTTYVFLFAFLPAILAVYYATPARFRSLLLSLSSFVFYGWWRPDFVLLLLFSSAVDFVVSGRIAVATRDRRKRGLMITSCVTNLGLLGYFKYANFGVDQLNHLLASLGHGPVPLAAIVLPVGISFYTFQSMSYTIDVYRGRVTPTGSFVDFVCYVSLFPQLVAGPIVRYVDLAEQLRTRRHTFKKFATGVLLFQIGFVKKVLIADSVGEVADRVYGMIAVIGESADDAVAERVVAIANPSLLESWIATSAYGFQIYFDFSGYSDMAIGLGMMFGFVFPMNFDSPYQSKSITEFWRRWHVSLSSWLRDYLYIPLGGNQRGPTRTHVNLALTMILGGLWHGAAWTFIAWGAYQGFWLILERLCGKRSLYAWAPAPVQVFITFLIAMGGWVFFRADHMTEAFHVLGSMFGMGEGGLFGIGRLGLGDRMAQLALIAAAALAFFFRPSQEQVRSPGWAVSLVVPVFFGIAVIHTFFQAYRPFLYFQF